MKVLFLSVSNAGRTLIAESLANYIFGGRIEFSSAGTDPDTAPIEVAIALGEVGLEMKNDPKHISELDETFLSKLDYVFTICDGTACPYIQTEAVTLHWDLEDPSRLADRDERIESYRKVREEIKARLFAFRSESTERIFTQWNGFQGSSHE